MELSILSKQIGVNIAHYRKKRGLTQVQLAELVDLEKETISRIESGKHNLSIKNLEKFTKILAVQAIDLVKKDDADLSSTAERIAILMEGITIEEQEKIFNIISNIRELCFKR